MDPCIPKDWKGFEVTRKFRGATYNIKVENPNGVSKGVKKITVNGKIIESTVLPILEAGKTHSVVVELG